MPAQQLNRAVSAEHLRREIERTRKAIKEPATAQSALPLALRLLAASAIVAAATILGRRLLSSRT